MHPELARVIQLQELEDELRGARDRLADVPRKRSEADAALEAGRIDLSRAKEELEASQRTRRQSEGQLQDFEAKRSRLKGQLMDVKTNKEYTAMLHEIEAVEREISGCEDRILAEMERADELTDGVAREEAGFAEAAASHGKQVTQLEAVGTQLEEECRKLEKQREVVAAGLPEELRERFERVAKLRGAAVSEARDGVCSQCRVKLRLQLFVEVKRNDAIRQCDSCSRILFYAPIEEVAPLP